MSVSKKSTILLNYSQFIMRVFRIFLHVFHFLKTPFPLTFVVVLFGLEVVFSYWLLDYVRN
jgi:hypothetical protein